MAINSVVDCLPQQIMNLWLEKRLRKVLWEELMYFYLFMIEKNKQIKIQKAPLHLPDRLSACQHFLFLNSGLPSPWAEACSPPEEAVCIFISLKCSSALYCTEYCWVRWMQRTRSSEQSCNHRVLQLQAYYHHRQPRIDREERQRRAKTGHDKRNQGDVIIRHNYVAVGAGRRGGQGDGWARRGSSCSKIVNKRENEEGNNMLC